MEKWYLAPLDTNLNPDPEQVDFDPVPFLPADSGAIIGWDGRAGTIEGLALDGDWPPDPLAVCIQAGMDTGSDACAGVAC